MGLPAQHATQRFHRATSPRPAPGAKPLSPSENMLARRTCALVLALALLGALTAVHAQTTPTAHGIAVAMAGGSTIELAVAGLWSFRVTAIFDHSAAGAPLVSPIVPDAHSAYADFKTTSGPGSFVGIATAFGEARIDPTTGAFALLDENQNVLTLTSQLASLQSSSSVSSFSFDNSTAAAGASNATCASLFPSTDARGGRRTSAHPNGLPGATQQSCCAACDADAECAFWVLDTSAHLCYLLADVVARVPAGSNRVTGGATLPTPAPPTTGPTPSPIPGHNDTCAKVVPGTDAVGGQRTPAHPNGVPGSTQQSCCGLCNSDADCSFWVLDTSASVCYLLMNVVKRSQNQNNRVSGGSTLPQPPSVQMQLGQKAAARFYGGGGGGGAPLTKTSSSPYVTNTAFQSPQYWSSEGYSAVGVSSHDTDPSQDPSHYPAAWSAASGAQTVWTILGARVDLYLMPAVAPADGLRAFWDLTGAPKVLPRHAFGFVACRWGWTDRAYIEQILQAFRAGQYPIDSFISDFEWYTPNPDYSLPDTGSPTFVDFAYNAVTFPEPAAQLAEYRSTYDVRFGGIRKPRLGNSDLIAAAKAKGWILPNAARNLNYSNPDVRAWYAEQITHFFADGVSYWWNDEGETQYFTFAGWNQAQNDALVAADPKKRFLTINRSYTPGMQRYGLVIWTGDISVSWDALAQTVGYLLNWAMSGVPYLTCDIGGFNGDDTPAQLLVRWYQVGAFLGVFRVHSKNTNTPHFPFLYDAASAAAMKKAMVLRYTLVPMLYSLAHAMYESGSTIQRPLFFEFPTDAATFTMTTQWMVGSSLLVAPVLTADNNVQAYLPAATWFEFGSATVHDGPTTLSLTNVAMDACPVFVRAGSIVPLAPSSLQFTDQLPGGPLNVQVYAGADATFVLIEDDGESRDYEGGAAIAQSVRHTALRWNEAARLLSWSVQGTFADAHTFVQVSATLFVRGGPAGGKTSAVVALGMEGSIQF